MIGLIFATMAEAVPFLSLSEAVQIDDKPFRHFKVPTQPALLVTVSGMGKVAAALACQAQIREFMAGEIVNAGVCGALHSDPVNALGSVFCIATAVEGDHEVFGEPPQPIISDGQIDWDRRAARLVTCDRPVFDDDERRALSATADLVDMEGAAVARVAAMYQVPWTMIKGITDTAGPQDRASLSANLSKVSEKIGNVLWEKLRNL
jgi:adenosylhomocysteine nucleosidase